MNERQILLNAALEFSLEDVLRRCARDPDYNRKVCQSGEFWRSLIRRRYPGIIELNTEGKQYYESITNQLENRPDLLPTDPLLSLPGKRVYLDAELAARESKKALDRFCNGHMECYENDFWKNMFIIFYSHIRGDAESYKEKYFQFETWKDFYFQVKRTPSILQTGFY